MQIIVPMSGFGERFRAAGYKVPKPLIEVEGKTIIEHVIDLFPGEKKFLFICNKDHLSNSEYNMRQILGNACPTGKIVAIDSHKKGPVHTCLQAIDHIDLEDEVIVNYCDFTCYWDYNDFLNMIRETKADGALPAYRGFHPSSLGSTYYAYIKHQNGVLEDIQEKKPFTDNPMQEFASSGTYYFKSGKLMQESFNFCIKEDLNINGEYYASLPYKYFPKNNLKAHIYPLDHFMQWGTPLDLLEYKKWSDNFKNIIYHKRQPQNHITNNVILMAGLGSRFEREGYNLPKPLIEVSGKPMVIQAIKDLAEANQNYVVTRKDLPHGDLITSTISKEIENVNLITLDKLTDGQARTCSMGLKQVSDKTKPFTVAACDNGVIFDEQLFDELLDNGADILVWTVNNYVPAVRKPEMYGWIQIDDNDLIKKVSVKKPLNDPLNDYVVIGTFTFKNVEIYERMAEVMYQKNDKVNNEFYIDNLINYFIENGYKCYNFPVKSYLGYGTPNELKTFNYWQSCFHKWKAHPYDLKLDPHVPAEKLEILDSSYKNRVEDWRDL